MKKKFLLPIIAIAITTCMGLVSCSSDKDASNDTSVTTESNVDSDETESAENASSTDGQDEENKSSAEKDTKNSKSESKKNDTKKDTSKKNDSKNSGSEAKSEVKHNENKNESSENKVMSNMDALNKILAHELIGGVPKYCIPVKGTGHGYDELERSEGSNGFLCNDDNKLDNGILVELRDFNATNDVNYFVIRDYNALKNGGKGLISSGTISKSGEVESK